ncbi:MAG: hypothetical protein U1E93_11980 [Alphaproteobacteria bacterium]
MPCVEGLRLPVLDRLFQHHNLGLVWAALSCCVRTALTPAFRSV